MFGIRTRLEVVGVAQNDLRFSNCLRVGVETISHIRENGRITVMFHAFDGPPRILRLYGTGASRRSIALLYLVHVQELCTNLAHRNTNLLFLQRPVSQALVQLSLLMYTSVQRYHF